MAPDGIGCRMPARDCQNREMRYRFDQVDVFTNEPFGGNPVAVIHDADALSTADMQQIANWTNLSETTFVIRPTDPSADYRVRIFTPSNELPFAGHPTIGTCHAWLEAGGVPQRAPIVQQCAAGLIELRRSSGRLAFAAPPLLRDGPLDSDTLAEVVRALRIDHSDVLDAAWVDNGPGWCAVRIASAADVLALRPLPTDLDIGVVGPSPAGSDTAIEVRAFFQVDGALREDPVTGSLNASLAQWLLGSGTLTAPYVAAQGTALGRSGRVHLDDVDGTIWVGGGSVTRIAGHLDT
jgi:PhzF family phenazine biosynthesis protein